MEAESQIKHSKLRIYKTLKKEFKLETYLLLFENYKHRK